MDIFKEQRDKYFPEIVFEKEYEKLTFGINQTQVEINSINEELLLLNQRRNLYYKRKAELLNQLEKLINNKNPQDG